MVYNINVEFQIRVKQTIEQNGQDKKPESAIPAKE